MRDGAQVMCHRLAFTTGTDIAQARLVDNIYPDRLADDPRGATGTQQRRTIDGIDV